MELFATVFIPVFLAELGDKTQLAALAMASGRSRTQKFVVFLACSAALSLCSAIAVGAGAFVGKLFADPRPVKIASGLLFLFFAWTTWKSRDEAEEEKAPETAKRPRSLFAGVFLTVFIAEMGDKTQLTTLGLAGPAREKWPIVLVAASAALSLSAAVAVAASTLVDRILSPRRLKTLAAVVFLALGLLSIVSAFR